MIFNTKIKRIFFILLFTFVITGSAVFISRVFSYDTDNAHPYLTEKAIELFNQNSEIQISEQQLEWMKQGAMEEDTPIRWMNHFYSPINGTGLFGFSSAKDWSGESVHQSLYPKGNQTWQKAVDSYAKGNKKEAFIALGHILHLIEDMSVPAHTRLDAHPEGDPYEAWAKDNNKKDFDNIAITEFNNLDDFFDVLANYSSKYFLSKDTIDTTILKNNEYFVLTTEQGKYKCIKGEFNQCLILIKKEFGEDKYFFDSPVHSDYYSLLAPKAFSYGAGAIDLFFKEIEIAEQKEAEKSWFEKLKEKIFVSNQAAGPGFVAIPKSLEPSTVVDVGNLVSDIPAVQTTPTPTSSPTPTFVPTPLPISSPFPAETPTPSPVESPMPSIMLPPYPGFGGGGSGSPQENKSEIQSTKSETNPNDQNSNEENEQLEQLEQVEQIGPTPTPTPTPIPEPAYMDVVINEVAWAGTGNQTSQDEWIELYNRTSHDIDLDGWVLYAPSGKPYIPLSKIISANGYYLLERKDNETVNDISADLIYGNGGSDWALNNSGEVLILSYASTTIDQTVLCDNKWCSNDGYKYRAMERIDPDIAGTDSSNWYNNNGLIMNGKTSKGGLIFGTPKARNSISYLISNGAGISSNIILSKARSPYLVNRIQIIQAGATLFIEPGVVIKFYGDSGFRFTENSKVIVQGTEADPVIFTSFYDDEYGGDINNDATTTLPCPGSWYGVKIESNNSDSIFDRAIFRYGGQYVQYDSNLNIFNSSASISNSIFEYSNGYGLYLANSSSTVSNSIIRNNKGSNPAGYNAGIMISGGAPKIQNNTISNNGYGISMASDEAIIDSNVFDSNEREAIVSNGLSSVFTNNSGSNNFINAIAVSGELTRANTTVTARVNSLPYYFWAATVTASSTLIIEPGTVIKGAKIPYAYPINVYGNLIISGVSSDDVVFTSLYDDSAGGDTDNDGGVSTISIGDWMGLVMKPGSYSEISGATFKYAGAALNYQNSPINLSSAKFINNTIAISADSDSIVQNVATTTLEFIGNTTDVSPADLW